VNYFRIYTDDDGETHFEDLDITLHPQPNGAFYSESLPATGIIFRRNPAEQIIDWHPAPRRQFVITLSGEAEIEASDGEIRRVGPGSIMLAEDITGKGHITRGVGTEDRLSIFVPLAEEPSSD
jgi:hypothetical protein